MSALGDWADLFVALAVLWWVFFSGKAGAMELNQWSQPTELRAVANAMDAAAACSQNKRECGGAIFKVKGQEVYIYSEPVTSERQFGVDLTDADTAPLPDTLERVADYHVHICSKHNQPFAAFFSSSDASVNDGLHLKGYMMDICTGNIHLYEPGVDDRDDEEVDFKSGKVIYLTIGRIVGWTDARRLL